MLGKVRAAAAARGVPAGAAAAAGGRSWHTKWTPSGDDIKTVSGSKLAEGVNVFPIPDGWAGGPWSDERCAEYIEKRSYGIAEPLKRRVSLSRSKLVQGQVVALLDAMRAQHWDVGTQTYNRVIQVISWVGNAALAARLLRAMQMDNVGRTALTYALLVEACVRSPAEVSERYLVDFLASMRADGIRPSDWLWLALLKFYVRQGTQEQAAEIWRGMENAGAWRGPIAWTLWIRAQEDMRAACDVFAEFLEGEGGAEANQHLFQSVFHAAAKNGEHREAQRLFESIKKGAWYDVVMDFARQHRKRAAATAGGGEDTTGTPTTDPASPAAEPWEAWDGGRQPSPYTNLLIPQTHGLYHAYLKVFTQAGLVRQTEQIVQALQAAGHRPDHITYCMHIEAIAVAARRRAKPDLGQKTQLLVMQAHQEGMLSCRRLYHAAMAVYAALGDVTSAEALRGLAAAYGVDESVVFVEQYVEAYRAAGLPLPSKEAGQPRARRQQGRVLPVYGDNAK